MSKHILVLLLFGCLSTLSQAQNLKGLVTNEGNQPLEGAYVHNLTTETHAHTSETGVFIILNTKKGDSLRVGLLGYKAKTLVLDSDAYLKIMLQEKAFQLDELVIEEELNTARTISRLDLKVTPVNSSQEVR